VLLVAPQASGWTSGGGQEPLWFLVPVPGGLLSGVFDIYLEVDLPLASALPAAHSAQRTAHSSSSRLQAAAAGSAGRRRRPPSAAASPSSKLQAPSAKRQAPRTPSCSKPQVPSGSGSESKKQEVEEAGAGAVGPTANGRRSNKAGGRRPGGGRAAQRANAGRSAKWVGSLVRCGVRPCPIARGSMLNAEESMQLLLLPGTWLVLCRGGHQPPATTDAHHNEPGTRHSALLACCCSLFRSLRAHHRLPHPSENSPTCRAKNAKPDGALALADMHVLISGGAHFVVPALSSSSSCSCVLCFYCVLRSSASASASALFLASSVFCIAYCVLLLVACCLLVLVLPCGLWLVACGFLLLPWGCLVLVAPFCGRGRVCRVSRSPGPSSRPGRGLARWPWARACGQLHRA
jgi:hypothetical protein